MFPVRLSTNFWSTESSYAKQSLTHLPFLDIQLTTTKPLSDALKPFFIGADVVSQALNDLNHLAFALTYSVTFIFRFY
jgi:hypothetical protein